MTKPDSLQCVHEPFGDAWYYGPERLSDRFSQDSEARENGDHGQPTFKDIFESIEQQHEEVCIPNFSLTGSSEYLSRCFLS
jgi:hypothetical protein